VAQLGSGGVRVLHPVVGGAASPVWGLDGRGLMLHHHIGSPEDTHHVLEAMTKALRDSGIFNMVHSPTSREMKRLALMDQQTGGAEGDEKDSEDRAEEDEELWRAFAGMSPEERARVLSAHDKQWTHKILELRRLAKEVSGAPW
jgi:hypothetical protein